MRRLGSGKLDCPKSLAPFCNIGMKMLREIMNSRTVPFFCIMLMVGCVDSGTHTAAKPGTTNLTGNWMLVQSEATSKPRRWAMMTIQNAGDLKLRGAGSDNFGGDFTVDGAVTLPSRINFTKTYKKSGKIVVFQGELKLESNPLYMTGQWKVKDAAKPTEKTEAVPASGNTWEANFYPEPAYIPKVSDH
jgi:hypothetical protein